MVDHQLHASTAPFRQNRQDPLKTMSQQLTETWHALPHALCMQAPCVRCTGLAAEAAGLTACKFMPRLELARLTAIMKWRYSGISRQGYVC
jgi:hypothetical protein